MLHERWGEGAVLTVSGAGDGAEATIAFSEVGEKRVLLAYAPLRQGQVRALADARSNLTRDVPAPGVRPS